MIAANAQIIAITTSKSGRANPAPPEVRLIQTALPSLRLIILIGSFGWRSTRHQRQLGKIRRCDERKIPAEYFLGASPPRGARVRTADDCGREQPLFENSTQIDLARRPARADSDHLRVACSEPLG